MFYALLFPILLLYFFIKISFKTVLYFIVRSILPPHLAQIVPIDAEGQLAISGIQRRALPVSVHSKIPKTMYDHIMQSKMAANTNMMPPQAAPPVMPISNNSVMTIASTPTVVSNPTIVSNPAASMTTNLDISMAVNPAISMSANSAIPTTPIRAIHMEANPSIVMASNPAIATMPNHTIATTPNPAIPMTTNSTLAMAANPVTLQVPASNFIQHTDASDVTNKNNGDSSQSNTTVGSSVGELTSSVGNGKTDISKLDNNDLLGGKTLNSASECQEVIDTLKAEMQGHFMQFHMHRQHIQVIQIQIQQLMQQTQVDNLPADVIKDIQMRVQTHHQEMQSHYLKLQKLTSLSENVQIKLQQHKSMQLFPLLQQKVPMQSFPL